MGEEKKCKKCGEPIDGDGNFCSNCRIKPGEKFPVDMNLKYQQGRDAMEKFSNMNKNDNLG